MPIEIQMLIYTSILGVLQLFASAQAATAQRGLSYNMSSRDKKMPDLTGKGARIDRAYRNLLETFPFFVAGVLCLQATNRFSGLSALGAQLYFWGRLIYIPIYVFGIPVVRTIVWLITILGLALIFWSAI